MDPTGRATGDWKVIILIDRDRPNVLILGDLNHSGIIMVAPNGSATYWSKEGTVDMNFKILGNSPGYSNGAIKFEDTSLEGLLKQLSGHATETHPELKDISGRRYEEAYTFNLRGDKAEIMKKYLDENFNTDFSNTGNNCGDLVMGAGDLIGFDITPDSPAWRTPLDMRNLLKKIAGEWDRRFHDRAYRDIGVSDLRDMGDINDGYKKLYE